MRSVLTRLAGVVAGLLLTAPVVAQQPIVVRPGTVYNPYGVAPVTLQAQTTVVVPDGGVATVARYGTYSEARNEFGTPGLGKVPYVGRGFRNIGYGRAISSSSISVRVRVFSLAEEEERQLGPRR
jgi:hypothetical protein